MKVNKKGNDMKDGVAVVNCGETPKSCTVNDMEHYEKGVAEISRVDEDGEPSIHKETDFSESYGAYYYCDNCEGVFDIYKSGQALAWETVKEHLSE